jgi:hypothetical protein
MIATREGILAMLPPYRDAWLVVHPDQSVRDIIAEVLEAHKEFASHYDIIAPLFERDTIEETCAALYWFCKNEIAYNEESDEAQTTAIPAGILTRGYGDCKHYAGFCGGVLDALNRRGKKINWCYRFASYKVLESTPGHVFVVVKDSGGERWIDPTPGAQGLVPIWQIDKKVKSMALLRNIAGIEEEVVESTAPVPDVNSLTQEELVSAVEEVDTTPDIPENVFNSIATLIIYGVMLEDGSVLLEKLNALTTQLPESDAVKLAEAYNIYQSYVVQSSTVAGFFDDAWRSVKVVSLAVPRNAFLGLVALNVFGMASKMSRLLAIPDAKKKLLDKWYSLGGKHSALEGAINSGAKKKAILGGVGAHAIGAAPAAAAPVWLTVAAGIIAAIMPLVTSLLKQNSQYTPEFAAIDSGTYNYGVPGSGNFFDSIKAFIVQNPIPTIAGAGLIIYLLWKD